MSDLIKEHMQRRGACIARSLEMFRTADASIEKTTRVTEESLRLIRRSRQLLNKPIALNPDAAHD